MTENMLLSPDALHCLKRKQLTNLCRRFGIKAVGKNADLIRQLQEYAASNIPADSPTKGNVAVLRHVKRSRQSDSSVESSSDVQQNEEPLVLPLPPLTPCTRQKRVSELVQAIEEEVKRQTDGMDTDDEMEEDGEPRSSRKNTIVFPVSSPTPSRKPRPFSPPSMAEDGDTTQPLRIIKNLPSSNRLASPLSTDTILEMSRPAATSPLAEHTTPSLYPDVKSLTLPEGVSSECLTSSSTLPSITSRQFSAAAASVLAEMNARLTAAGRSTTSGSLTTLSSLGNGTWQSLAASASAQGMSKSRSGRYEIHHERQFNKMDSIVNHYAARRVGAGADGKCSPPSDSSVSASSNSAVASKKATSATATVPATARKAQRVDASTSTRSLAAMARSTSARKVPIQRRPLPTPPVSQARKPSSLLSSSGSIAKNTSSRQASGAEPPRAKRLRLAVSEDQDALQNTVLEIPPEKKTVVIHVTRPEREGMPYKFSVASSRSDVKVVGEGSGSVRAASSLRKTVIKATKSTFVGGGSAKKTAASMQAQKREAAFAKQQQQQAAMSRSISSRANLAPTTISRANAMTPSTSVRNKFTGVVTTVHSTNGEATSTVDPSVRKPLVTASASSGGSAAHSVTEANKHGSVSSRFGGSIRSSVSQGLGRAEVARQARLKEIKARTKAALAGFGSQRNVSASTTTSAITTSTMGSSALVSTSPQKAVPAFSSSVTRPTIASLGRARTTSSGNGSASLPMLSAITQTLLEGGTSGGLQRASTMHAGVGKALMPCLTPRSSSLRHLRRVMRKQQKEADLEQVRVVAAENIAPGTVVPSVASSTPQQSSDRNESKHGLSMKPSIRTVAARGTSPLKTVTNKDKYTTMPAKTRTRAMGTAGAGVRPAGPRAALVTSIATTSALNRL